jgi:dCMP deaminase
MKKKKINHYTVDEENPVSWDHYFYLMAKTAASNSKCLSRKIGCVIADGHTIISTGYNGPPRGIMTCDKRWIHDVAIRKEYNSKKNVKTIYDGDIGHDSELLSVSSPRFQEEFSGKCPRYVKAMGFKSGQGLEWCVAGHAERNAIVNAARKGMPALEGCSIYMTCGVPCTPCLVEIINAGIEEIVCTEVAFYDFDRSCKYLIDNAPYLNLRVFDFI